MKTEKKDKTQTGTSRNVEKWDKTEQNTSQKKQWNKEGETEEDGGRETNTDRVHVFHHAICEALINVSLSLQRRLLAETPRPPHLPPSWILPLADTIPPPAVATSAAAAGNAEKTEVKCEILIASRARECVCVFQPHSM